MNTFLQIVAKDIISKYGNDLSRIAVVFPNKRASLFLNEELFRCAGKPVWAPTYLTISDLFRNASQLAVGDPLKLVCDVYKSFVEVTKKDETLDHFFDWGKLLISDFDDIDKNMADAGKLFANVANVHELDDVSYLTDEQKEILKTFFSNFSDEHNSKLKEMFLSLWNKLGDIYHNFRNRLQSQGIAYEGMLYRDVVESNRVSVAFDKYIFVGFNLLQKVEYRLFHSLKEKGVAEFYWDYDVFYCTNATSPLNNREAGKYISAYVRELGSSLSEEYHAEAYDNFRRKKGISFVKAKTENIQARYVSQWLKENNRFADGKRTAIVMCDESLLSGILHSMPPEAGCVNVTTGYPLSNTPVASLVSQLLDMQTSGVRSDGGFRISMVRRILNHPYAKYLSDGARELYDKLKEMHIVYPSDNDLRYDDSLAKVFTHIESNRQLIAWLLYLLKTIAGKSDDVLYTESVFNMYTLLNRLSGLLEKGELDVDRITMQKLIKQLVASTSIPFHGEPAVGIQVMGLLETRNLDFDHILLLSCNEGNMPKGIRDSSFVPYSIRKAYALTTVDNKVAIYSYYFYRLLQRAKDVTIVYNTSTENGNRGEMSRFMLQLMVESGHQISRLSLHAGQTSAEGAALEVAKSNRVMDILYGYDSLSPTAINRYIRCPMQFYFNNIAGIREPDEDIEEQLTSRAFGNIFHNSLEEIYKEYEGIDKVITSELIGKLSERSRVERVVDRMFQREMYGEDESRWRPIKYNGMQLLSRTVLVKYVTRLLEIDRSLTPFSIIGLEKAMYKDITISTPEGEKKVSVGGRIDRLDMVSDPQTGRKCIRVIDYKTGGSKIKTPVAEIGQIFEPSMAGTDKHTEYYLQAMLYSLIVRDNKKLNPQSLPVVPALIFIQHAFGEDYDPTLLIGKARIDDIASYAEEYEERLSETVSKIYDSELPFSLTPNSKLCEYCPYKSICGR